MDPTEPPAPTPRLSGSKRNRVTGAGDGPATAHYPWVTRLLLSLLADDQFENVVAIDVEPRYGFVGRIRYRNGGVRLFTGVGLQGLNNSAAHRVVRDKGWSRFLLESLDYSCPNGEKFVLDMFAEKLNRRLSRPQFKGYLLGSDAIDWIHDNLTYPVYVKPARGSQGKGVFRCRDDAEVLQAIELYGRRAEVHEAFLVEEAITMPDYRVIVVDEEVICCYERSPLAVEGDGHSSVVQLVEARQAELDAMGRPERIDVDDVRLVRNVAAAGYDLDEVLPDGLRLVLLEVSNLSAGGDAVDHTDHIDPRWAQLCVEVTADFGMHLCGVDLACTDIRSPDGPYSILELNGAPGLDNYLSYGERSLNVVRELYRRVFDACDDLRVLPHR